MADWGLVGEGFARGVPLLTLGEVNQPTLEFGRGGGEMARAGLMGREKLTPELSSLFNSGIVGKLSVLPALSTLVLRFALLGLLGVLGLGGILVRLGTSRLAALLCVLTTFLGMTGTGGASGAGDTALGLPPGEGDRKVRSVMDELLAVLTMLFLAFPPMIALPATEDWEPLLTMRLVWMEPTGSGDEVCERRAVAAAAEDREAADGDLLRKAALAAMAAEELGGGPRGSGWSGCEQ